MEALFIFHKGVGGGVEVPQPARQPGRPQFHSAPLEVRETIENPIDNQRRQRLLNRCRNGQIGQGRKIRIPPVEIGHRRQPVHLVGQIDLLLAPHVEHDGQARFLSQGPHGEESNMAGAVILRAPGRHHEGLRTHLDGGPSGFLRLLKVF